MVGMGSDGSRESLETQLRHVRGRFGIGLVDWVMRSEPGLLQDALAARPALLSVSFGTDWSWAAKAHDAGIATVTQVYDSLGARQAVDAGIDILVARVRGWWARRGKARDAAVARHRLGCLGGHRGAGARGRRHRVAAKPGRRAGRRCERGVGGHPPGGMSGGADRRRQPPGADRGPGHRHRHHPGLRRRQGAALAGAVPVARVDQRLRRALDGPRGCARPAGPRRTGGCDRRRRPPHRPRRCRRARRDGPRRRVGGRSSSGCARAPKGCWPAGVDGRVVTPRAGSAWR
jgi:hypothetical protein